MKKIVVYIICIVMMCYFLLYLTPIIFPGISTKYAENFDIEIFNKIKIGDDRHSVDNLLGKPIYISTDNINEDSIKINYWYSEDAMSLMEYDKIVIQFYHNKVINKIRVLDGD